MSSAKTGKTIVSITNKKKAVILVFDDGSKLEMGLDSFTESPLYEGKNLTDKDFAKLKQLASGEAFYENALKMCLSESRTVHEVWKKLEGKGASEETIKNIIHRLKNAGLLNDEMFAKIYATDIADLRLYGRKRVIFELKKKGIPETILASLPNERKEELSRALRYAEVLNKRADHVPNGKKKIKMIQGLMERGFAEEIAKEAVESVATENDEGRERNALQRDFCAYKARYERKYKGYDLSQRIQAALLKKGYRYEDIKEVMEVVQDDD